MLIRNAELNFGEIADVRLAVGRIVSIAPKLEPAPGEAVLDARGGALLPGLHDHHIHLVSLAVALESLSCGPPQVNTETELVTRLRERSAALDDGEWIRGFGYHESVAGDIDRDWLDLHVADRPVRIQQRSGRLWIVNSCALEQLGVHGDAALPAGLELIDGRPSGRIYDADAWLRDKLPRGFPPLARVGALLAGYGVTGVTDTTPHNDLAQFRHFVAARAAGEMAQEILVMGDASLDTAIDARGVCRGPTKIHLHESDLPLFDDMVSTIRRSHDAGRPIAIHCVTVAELVFSLGALECAGAQAGDRIEHAAVAPPDVLPLLVAQGVTVVTQPNFILERGDAYLRDVALAERPWLYRLRGLLDAGIPVGGSTDAPFGDANPWLSMHAAVQRRSASGSVLGAVEALAPEDALALFTSAAHTPGGPPRRIAVGAAADLCLLDRPWAVARRNLSKVRVVATLKDGASLYSAL